MITEIVLDLELVAAGFSRDARVAERSSLPDVMRAGDAAALAASEIRRVLRQHDAAIARLSYLEKDRSQLRRALGQLGHGAPGLLQNGYGLTRAQEAACIKVFRL